LLKAHAGLETNVLRDPGSVDRILAVWAELWERCVNATPFQRPEWLCAWMACFRPQQPLVIVVSLGNQIVGLAPLLIYTRDGQRVLGLMGGGVSDYLDVLIDPSFADEALAIIWEQIKKEASNWDAIDLTDLPATSALLRRPAPRLPWVIEMHDACPVLSLPIAGKTLNDIVPRQQLRNLRNARNRLARIGNAQIELASPETLPAFLDAIVKLHSCRWAQEGLPGMFSDPAIQKFHRLIAPQLLEKGILRLYGLRAEGQLIAVLYALFEKETAYYYLQGFDFRWRWFSPGTQILGAVLEDALREGKNKIDFLRGRESYKYQWGAHDEPTFRLSTRWATQTHTESTRVAA
jgi:CelD/BcsL family acetyltransferase involved in cellulose biosynthesis